MKNKCMMILLAAGKGSRMASDIPKQFMELDGKPLVCKCLEQIEKSEIIDNCILVTGEESIPYVRKEIVAKYGYQKVLRVIAGGKERYASVQNALDEIRNMKEKERPQLIYVQDGARPFLTEELIEKLYYDAMQHGACVAAVPSKDTVKLTDASGMVVQTPPRATVWIVQTPQVFQTDLLLDAYGKMREKEMAGEPVSVTDDAGVVEQYGNKKVYVTESYYENIKITTPEDLVVAKRFLEKA